MKNQIPKTNFEIARDEADKADQRILQALAQGKNFRVEAGAGSGKTYSLNRVVEWLQENKWEEYSNRGKKVACITYTNAAVDVIAERLSTDSFIEPSTIHAFAWGAIKQFQGPLKEIIQSDSSYDTEETDFTEISKVSYDLGHRYVTQGVYHLYHDDVIKLFVALLEKPKFRRVFADQYPLILIDEYQDSFKSIIDQFLKYFIEKNTGPQFGFFGDSWQTIYQSQKACGKIENPNIIEIPKGSNFRSAPRIVKMLNKIRSDLPQQSAIDDFEGEVCAITCDDYTGHRRTDRNFKGDIPAAELKDRLGAFVKYIRENVMGPSENIKVLMITHKVLAAQQGYEKLLSYLDEGIRDKDNPFLQFFMKVVEPIYKALSESDMQLLFDTLETKRYPISRKCEKIQWKDFLKQLTISRQKKSIDVLTDVIQSGLVPISPEILTLYKMYFSSPDLKYSGTTLKEFLDLEYSQFLTVINFLYPDAEFSTEHGVKGEEYDNVVFVISKGWNQYQFEKYMPMIKKQIPTGSEDSFIRNRNLFYVCCSRPRKRLFFFVSIPLEAEFREFLEDLVGTEKIFTYSQYMGKT